VRGILFVATLLAASYSSSAQAQKPVIHLEKDGYPGGHATPEGAACDLARAFINRDVALYRSTCIKPFGGGEGRKQYEAFMKQTSRDMEQEAMKPLPSPYGPRSIGAVFAARHLSKNGPASYGYATFNFKDVMFVDVGVYLGTGKRSMARTMVIEDSTGNWYVDPVPTASPLLSDGLNKEKASTVRFTEVYTVKK
jgi:hypothetical protein